MSAILATRRRRSILWVAGVAAFAALLGGLTFLPPARPPVRVEVGEKVLPDFAANADKVQLVMVTTADEVYHLVHNDDGWVLAEKGSYPVEPERIAELIRGLSAITYARPMTRDERKFDRIGLGDPAIGGTGALLEAGDGSGANFARLLVGYRDGRSYVRMTDDLQAWAVDGAVLPPLQRGARWLDLDVVDVEPDDIAEVLVRPAQGPAYRLLAADETGRQFMLAPPYASRQPVTNLAFAMAGQSLARLAPVDVARADAVAIGAPLAEHVTRLRSGVAVILHSWRADGRYWVTVGAAADERASPEAIAAANAINQRAAGWAFALTELDWKPFSLPLSELVE
ncbi:MAG TPA: DUF4340 domain-containing protein [Hyphomonadaceae bacterium]|nr:DUF4340 domain-containing protein [Hyphomonadaceae bacterium]